MKEANNLFVKIKMEISLTWEIGDIIQNVSDFSDENALEVAVKRFCCVSNSIRHVSQVFLDFLLLLKPLKIR